MNVKCPHAPNGPAEALKQNRNAYWQLKNLNWCHFSVIWII